MECLNCGDGASPRFEAVIAEEELISCSCRMRKRHLHQLRGQCSKLIAKVSCVLSETLDILKALIPVYVGLLFQAAL